MHGAEKLPHSPTLHAPPLPSPHHRTTPNPSATFTLARQLPPLTTHRFSATRSFALRDRGLISRSKAAAVCARRVSTRPTSFAPHWHTGNPAGQTHSPSNRRSARLTMRSSSE